MKFFKRIRGIIKFLKTKRLGVGVSRDIKLDFEQEILNLLKKFDLYDDKNKALQGAEIFVDIDSVPKVNLRYILIDREGGEK